MKIPFKKKQPQKQEKTVEEMKAMEKDYQTVDYSRIKDFLTWGMNRALNDIRLTRMTDIKTREKLAKQKPEHDWTKIMVTVLVIVVVGAMAFGMLNQFLNYQDIAERLAECAVQNGVVRGEMEVLKARSAGNIIGTITG